MRNFTRANNAIYGAAFEQAIVNLINYCALLEDDGEYFSFDEAADACADVDNWAEDGFVDEETGGIICESVANILGEFADDRDEVYQHARIAADEIAAYGAFSIDYPAQRIGGNTKLEDGDIRLANGALIEVKYVKNKSLGTYNNMSMNAVADQMGFQRYTGADGYLTQQGWENTLRSLLGDELFDYYEVDCTLSSPMSIGCSHEFRHAYPALYKKVAKKEVPIRKAYVSSFNNYILGDETLSRRLLTNLLGKEFSGKSAPDYYLVFRRDNQTCRIVDLDTALGIYLDDYAEDEDITEVEIEEQLVEEPLDDVDEDGEITEEFITPHLRGGYSIVFPNVISMTFAWQNGSGLSNPTVRSFLLI